VVRNYAILERPTITTLTGIQALTYEARVAADIHHARQDGKLGEYLLGRIKGESLGGSDFYLTNEEYRQVLTQVGVPEHVPEWAWDGPPDMDYGKYAKRVIDRYPADYAIGVAFGWFRGLSSVSLSAAKGRLPNVWETRPGKWGLIGYMGLYWLVSCPLALVGLIAVLIRRRGGPLRSFAWLTLGATALVIAAAMTQGAGRYRTTVEPFLVIYSAWLLHWLWARLSRGRTSSPSHG
jgi:hypothetical protein